MRTSAKNSTVGEIVSEKYKLLEELGSGGMGIVYKAEQIKPVKRSVALKIIKLGMDTRQVVARFETERQALAVMDHPNIAKVYDGGATETGRPYFVMELVRGIPITEYCDRHKLTTRERLELFIHVCEAIQHAHQKGVIHRDLKPSNILITVQQEKPIPKIIDFGIAKATAHSMTERTLFTEQGQLIGTPEYMSPEQAEMSGLDVDTRTDIYSLGVILYELIVGALPFDPETLRKAGIGEIQRIIRETDPPKASNRLNSLGDSQAAIAEQRKTDVHSLQRELKGDLSWIAMKAMEKDRTRRYGSPIELAEDIRRHLRHEPVGASPPSQFYKMRKFLRRHKYGAAAAGTFMFLLIAFLITYIVNVNRERNRAEQEASKAKVISEFMQETLGSADPYGGQGREITVYEALSSAVKNIEGSFDNQPEIAAAVKNTIGYTYMELGRYEEAEPLLKSALEVRKTRLGEKHPETLDSMFNLAALYIRHKNRYLEAQLLLKNTLEMRQRVLGEEHPETLTAMKELAYVYMVQGSYDEAEHLYRKTLEMRRRILGEEHPDTLSALHGLVSVFRYQRNFDKAEEFCRKLVDIRSRILGEEHPSTASTINLLSLIYTDQGLYNEAEPLALRALNIYDHALGEDHSFTLTSMITLAWIYTKLAQYKKAENLYQKTLGIRRRISGEEDIDTMNNQIQLASLYRLQELYKKAELLYAEVITLMKRKMPTHYRTSVALLGYGKCLVKLGRYSEAEVAMLEARTIREREYGTQHARTLSVIQSLVNLYEAWDKPNKAAECQALMNNKKVKY